MSRIVGKYLVDDGEWEETPRWRQFFGAKPFRQWHHVHGTSADPGYYTYANTIDTYATARLTPFERLRKSMRDARQCPTCDRADRTVWRDGDWACHSCDLVTPEGAGELAAHAVLAERNRCADTIRAVAEVTREPLASMLKALERTVREHRS